MGGKVLDLPEIRIFHEGKAEGLAEGEKKGLAKGERQRKKLSDENASLRKEIERLKAEMNK